MFKAEPGLVSYSYVELKISPWTLFIWYLGSGVPSIFVWSWTLKYVIQVCGEMKPLL